MTTAVCCIAKLENHYIREWVEHYKKLGFDNVIIYDNNDKDGEKFDEVISDYIESGYVIINDYRGQISATRSPSSSDTNIQIKAYRNAYKTYEDKFDWILFCDADEFLILEFDKSIQDFINRPCLAVANALKFSWKYYDDNDLVTVENDNYNLLNRFTRYNSSASQNSQGKCMLKTKQNIEINSAHCFGLRNTNNEKNVVCLGATGKSENKTGPFMNQRNNGENHKVAWLNHYRYKTIQEYLELKRIRLYPDQSKENAERLLRVDGFFVANKRTSAKTDYINKHGDVPVSKPQIKTVNNPVKLSAAKQTELKAAGENLKKNEQFKSIINSLNNGVTISKYKLYKLTHR